MTRKKPTTTTLAKNLTTLSFLAAGSFIYFTSSALAQDPPNATDDIRKSDEIVLQKAKQPEAKPGKSFTTHGDKSKVVQDSDDEDKTSLDLFSADASYVGESKIRAYRNFPTSRFGNQDAIHQNYDYAHRIQLVGRTYLRLGVDYDRFDFGTSYLPVPTRLQSLSAVVGVEYVVQNHPAIFFRSNPGVYCSTFDKVSLGAFDAPTEMGLTFKAMKDMYMVVGIRASLLSNWPVIPIGGLVWLLNDKWRLEAVPPQPEIVYAYSDNLELFAGVELMGNSYKTGKQNYSKVRPDEQRLSNGVVSYSETRGVVGFSYKMGKYVSADVSGGWDFERQFRYFRSHGRHFDTEGAPFGKLALSAEF